MCAFCKQGVLKTDMDYQKGKVFHAQCFTEHGKDFTTPDSELAQLSAKTRIELVQLKNMRVRAETQKQTAIPAKKKAGRKQKKKPKKQTKPKRTNLKAKRTKRKAKKIKRKSKKSKKKSRRRR